MFDYIFVIIIKCLELLLCWLPLLTATIEETLLACTPRWRVCSALCKITTILMLPTESPRGQELLK